MHDLWPFDAPRHGRYPVDLVVQRSSTLTRYGDRVNSAQRVVHSLASAVGTLSAQVDEGDVEVVNIRETDSRLGPLIIILVVLGVLTLLATCMYWWVTRPSRTIALHATEGDDDG